MSTLRRHLVMFSDCSDRPADLARFWLREFLEEEDLEILDPEFRQALEAALEQLITDIGGYRYGNHTATCQDCGEDLVCTECDGCCCNNCGERLTCKECDA